MTVFRFPLVGLLALPLAAAAQAPAGPAPAPAPSTEKCLIAPGSDGPDISAIAPAPRRETLVGYYACEEDHFHVSLRLNADGTFAWDFGSTEPPDPFQETVTGRWRLKGPELHLVNAPGRPPRLARDRALRDPRVLVSVSATLADGTPADDLEVVVDMDKGQLRGDVATGAYRLTPEVSARAGAGTKARAVTVFRRDDDAPLARIPLSAKGPNNFHFVYTPSDARAFDQDGLVVSAARGVLVLAVGQGATYVRRRAE